MEAVAQFQSLSLVARRLFPGAIRVKSLEVIESNVCILKGTTCHICTEDQEKCITQLLRIYSYLL